MKITTFFASLTAILVLGITVRNAPAQETIGVAIPLFPTAVFSLACTALGTWPFEQNQWSK